MSWNTVFSHTYTVDASTERIILPITFSPYFRLIISTELLTGLGEHEPFLGSLSQQLAIPGIGAVKGQAFPLAPFLQLLTPATEFPYQLIYQPVQRQFSFTLTIQAEETIPASSGSDNAPVLAAITLLQTQIEALQPGGAATDYTPAFEALQDSLAALGTGQTNLNTVLSALGTEQGEMLALLALLHTNQQAHHGEAIAKLDEILTLVSALEPGDNHRAAYEPETLALLDAFTGNYSVERQNAINALIQGLKADGLWTLLDRLYLAGLTESDSLLSWRSLVSATNVNMTFVADRGFTGNGTNAYLNTNFNPVTANGHYSLNSASLGLWSRTDANPTLARDMGCRSAFNDDESVLILREDGKAFYALHADANTDPVVMAQSTGCFSNSRTAVNALSLYRNGSSVATSALGSTQMPNQPIFIGAVNSGGAPIGFTTRQYSCSFLGAGFTAQQHSSLYDRLKTYLTLLGAN